MIIEFEQKQKRIPLDALIERIEYADHKEIDAIIDALQRRYQRLFPDWEVAYLSVPTGNPENQRKQARLLIEFIQNNWLNP